MTKVILFLWIPMCFFGDWIFWGLEEAMAGFDEERRSIEISFETQQPVSVECVYPVFSEQGSLVEYVNQALTHEATCWFDRIVQKERASKEGWEEGYGLYYELSPVYYHPWLISIFGSEYQGRGAHGRSYYKCKTFWQKKEGAILEVSLDDLFIQGSNYRQWMLDYCEHALKTSGYGYYSYRKELLPELNLEDLDTFVITNKGLMIIFRAYLVGGWGDGPDTITIPYADLKQWIAPQGPLQECF